MQQNVEQIDLFLYLKEIELQEAATHALAEEKITVPKTSVIDAPWSLISCLKTQFAWFIHNLPLLFGLVRWVNVYTVTRAFGGQEEGGWYYRRFTCVESRQVWYWDAEAIQMQLYQRFSGLAWGVISTDSVGQEVEVTIESRRAAQECITRPTYNSDLMVRTKSQCSSIEASMSADRSVQEFSNDPLKYKRSYTNVLTSTYTFTSLSTGEPCKRCKGTGTTCYKHIKNGICFKCKGSGKRKAV